jgi:hypothetical protein
MMRSTGRPGAGGTHAARRTVLFDIPPSPRAAGGLSLVRPQGRKPEGFQEMPRPKRPGLY